MYIWGWICAVNTSSSSDVRTKRIFFVHKNAWKRNIDKEKRNTWKSRISCDADANQHPYIYWAYCVWKFDNLFVSLHLTRCRYVWRKNETKPNQTTRPLYTRKTKWKEYTQTDEKEQRDTQRERKANKRKENMQRRYWERERLLKTKFEFDNTTLTITRSMYESVEAKMNDGGGSTQYYTT